MGQDRRDNPWERIASRLDEAYDDARSLAAPPPAAGQASGQAVRTGTPPAAERLIELLSDARRDVRAREVEASVAATRAARLETELAQAQRRGDTLLRIGKAINAVRELPALLQLVVDLAVDATGAERGLVVVPDSSGARREFTAVKNLDASDIG